MGAEQALKRIPRIKFPQRRPPSASGSISETQATSKDGGIIHSFISRSRSDVPAPPINTAVGGKASLLPKRTPVSDKEIEAILAVASDLAKASWIHQVFPFFSIDSLSQNDLSALLHSVIEKINEL